MVIKSLFRLKILLLFAALRRMQLEQPTGVGGAPLLFSRRRDSGHTHPVTCNQLDGTSNRLSGSSVLPSEQEPPLSPLPPLIGEDYHCSCELGEEPARVEDNLRLSNLEDNPCPQVASIIGMPMDVQACTCECPQTQDMFPLTAFDTSHRRNTLWAQKSSRCYQVKQISTPNFLDKLVQDSTHLQAKIKMCNCDSLLQSQLLSSSLPHHYTVYNYSTFT